MAVSIWIIKVAFDIYKESNIEMMDGVKDTNIYDKIFLSVEEVDGAYNPHRIRVRKISEFYLIALDIEVDKDTKVSEAHLIAKQLKTGSSINIDNIFDILVHIEPLGNIEGDESVGISKENMHLKRGSRPFHESWIFDITFQAIGPNHLKPVG